MEELRGEADAQHGANATPHPTRLPTARPSDALNPSDALHGRVFANNILCDAAGHHRDRPKLVHPTPIMLRDNKRLVHRDEDVAARIYSSLPLF